MKKIVALICLLAMLLPLCACSTGLATEETEPAENATAEKKTEEKKDDKKEITYPDTFAVGYAIGDISGQCPLPIYDGTAESIHDPLMLTCTAMSDGEGNVALVMSADLKGMQESVFNRSCTIIKKEFGIPAENVIIGCTHTHNAPTVGGNSAEMTRWLANYYKQLPIIVENALLDLAEVEDVYIGKGHTEGITFVRRYLLKNGKYQTNPSGNVVAHESQADPELRTIRWDRKDKKDVLMVNYQTHYGGATGMYKNQLSADYILPFRTAAEKKYDCLFAYQQGAGGDVNFNSLIPGERKYANFIDAIDGFILATDEALASEEKAEVGTIRGAKMDSVATVYHDSPEMVEAAKKISKMKEGSAEMQALKAQHGIGSERHVNAIITRAGMGETNNIPLSCITFGDFAFTAFPYEMFHENGRQTREGSPYKMTFVNSLAGGSFGYIPTKEAFPHGSYEVVTCKYTEGCGEQFVADMLTLLNQCKNAG